MELQQTTTSVLLASNVSTIVSSQHKSKTSAFKFIANINHHSYNKQLVWNRFALWDAPLVPRCAPLYVSVMRNNSTHLNENLKCPA